MPSEAVKVMVRVRPMNQKEKNQNCKSIVDIDDKNTSLSVNNTNEADSKKQFTFDYVFSPAVSQQFIYEQTAFPLVESVVEGYNGTMFAYGQTGCGKTFTMMGDPADEVLKGIIPRSFSHIVNIIETTKDKKYLVRCSYIEIYNEEVHDLLGKDVKQRMELKESQDKGVFIKDLTMIVVKSVAEMEKYMVQGNKNRAVGETQMNKDSSRSHSLFTLYIESSVKTKDKEIFTAGKLNMVDLAGSERQSKTQATGDRLKEGSKINLSLSALGNVISALVDGKTQHVPYRDSKLTRLLQDSLGGNTKTIMIAAASPADYNYEETMSTLRYASRAKFIKNQPKINEDPKDALLKEYAEEIKKFSQIWINRLKEMLQNQGSAPQQSLSAPNQPNTNTLNNSQVQKLNNSQLEKLSKENQQLSKQQQEFQSQLKAKEEAVERERKERERMEQMIKELEQKTIVGGKADEQQEKKFKAIQNKLKNQIKEQEKLRQEKEQKEEELMSMEKHYQSMQEEVESLRAINKKLKAKLKQAVSEIEDANHELVSEKAELTEAIRLLEKEVKMLSSITKVLLSADEIEQIKADSTWIEESNEYQVPPFYFKEKALKFPKLPYQQAMDMIEKEKESRDLVLKNPSKKGTKIPNDFSDLRDLKKTLQQTSDYVDSSLEINGRGDKDLGNMRFDRNKNSYPSNNDRAPQIEEKKQRAQLEPLEHQQINFDRAQKVNSQPPNGYPRGKNNMQLAPIQQSNFPTRNRNYQEDY